MTKMRKANRFKGLMTPARVSIRKKLRNILAGHQYDVPIEEGFEGTDAPRLYLLHLIPELKASKSARPKTGAWKVEFTSENSMLSLFAEETEPSGPSMQDIISHWSQVSTNGTAGFQRTVCGQSEDYSVADEEGTIRVRRSGESTVMPSWSHDSLLNAFASNAPYLIHVRGLWNERTRLATYESAEFLSEPRITKLINFIADGTICIDLGTHLKEERGTGHHGTKFLISPDDLHLLYSVHEPVE